MTGTTFIFESYESHDNQLDFHYSFKDSQQVEIGRFSEVYKLQMPINAEDPTVKYILQQLHTIIGISYYKSLLGRVELPYALDEEEATYWNNVYDEGLGEFAFVNQLTQPIRPFQATAPKTKEPVTTSTHQGALLGVGGGKDSIVASELFKRLGIETTTIDIATRENHGQAADVMHAMGLPEMHIERYVDTQIIDFTERHEGYHGHIPFSAVLAWLGILLAYVSGKRYITMANEAAASVGNTVWNGRLVNHQWSKSLEFETLTQQFVYSHISKDLTYFSPIRPYSSLTVLDLFTKWGVNYYEIFTSCNLVLRIDPRARPNGRWCTDCAKCLSTWLLLSVWLDDAELEKIFGRNLFKDGALQTTLKELLDLEGHKPLDCVGTSEELRAATRKALETRAEEPLLKGIDPSQIPGPELEHLIKSVGSHVIPEDVAPKLLALVAAALGSAPGGTNDIFEESTDG